MFNYQITLQEKVITKNELLQEEITYNQKTILTRLKNISRNEFYQAKQSKLKISYVFEINTIEFDAQYTHVLFNDKQYKIIRTYINNRFMELYCE